jgi:hypothetical protein
MEEPPVVRYFYEDLLVDDGSCRMRFGPKTGEPWVVGGREILFQMCRSQTQMGSVPVDQFWMPLAGVYGQRNRQSPNYQALIDCFWAQCWKHATVLHDDVQQSFILARLLPKARSNGARRVFADSTADGPKTNLKNKRAFVRELDELFRTSRDCELTEVDFRDRKAEFLGPPAYDPWVWDYYRELESEILGEGCSALVANGAAGLAPVMEMWQEKMRQIGRRAGNEVQMRCRRPRSTCSRTNAEPRCTGVIPRPGIACYHT